MNERDMRQIVAELQAVKMLLILQLIQQGTKQKQIAQMLGISEASMSRLLPKGLSKEAT